MIEYIRNLHIHVNNLLHRIVEPYENKDFRGFFAEFVGLVLVVIGGVFNVDSLVVVGVVLYALLIFRNWFLYLSMSLIMLTATLVMPSYILMAACLIGSIANGYNALYEYRKTFNYE